MKQTDTQVISVPEGKLRDYIDGVFRNDTPEEYVRQNIEKRLVNEHQYPKATVKIEGEDGVKLRDSDSTKSNGILCHDNKFWKSSNICT